MTAKDKNRITRGFLLLAVLTLGLACLNLAAGSTHIDTAALLHALFSADRTGSTARIVWASVSPVPFEAWPSPHT